MKNIIIIFSALFITILANGQGYDIYTEGFDHGVASGRMGSSNGSGLTIDDFSDEKPYKGDFCLKASGDGSEGWSGVFIQYTGTWRSEDADPEDFADLSAYKYLVFYARSDQEGTKVKAGFGTGNDSGEKSESLKLSTEWKRYVYQLGVTDMSSINGLFMIVFEGKATAYFDEIRYVKEVENKEGDILFTSREEALDADALYIYSDKWENGVPSGYMGDKDGASIDMNDSWSDNPYKGPKCIRFSSDNKETWRGLHIQYTGSWNVSLDDNTELIDLSEYDRLEFYGRTDDGYLILQTIGVGDGGEIGSYKEDGRSDSYIELTPKWRKYTLNLKGVDLSRINTMLYLVLPEGTIYLDEIKFINSKNKKKK